MTLPFGLDRTFSVLSPRKINRKAARVAMRLVCFAVLAVACRTARANPLLAHAGGVIPVGNGFVSPQGVAVDRNGNVFVADNHAVKEIVAVGGVVTSSSTVRTINSTFSTPTGIAVDGSGNVFVTDPGTLSVYEIVAVDGAVVSGTNATQLSALVQPTGIAVDGSGNIFITDQANNAVYEIVAVDGAVVPGTNPTQLSGSINNPSGVTVDGSGNVFVMDSNAVVKEFTKASNYATVNTIASGFSYRSGVAVDGSGNVFVTDYAGGVVKEIVAVNGIVSSSSMVTTIASGFNNPYGVAVDGSGNVFVGDAGNGVVKEIVLAAQKLSTTAVGSTSVSLPIFFTFDSGGSIGAPVVLTQGATGLDFADAGTGTCSTTATYSAGDTCTVDVTFTPKYPGQRLGAVQLMTTDGAVVATAHIYGTGTGPLVTFPGNKTVNTIKGGFQAPEGVAVDGNGNVFVADPGAASVYEIVAVGGVASSNSTVTQINNYFVTPSGVAVDGSGNIFVADTGTTSVYEIAAVNGVVVPGTNPTPIGSGFNAPTGVAVDGSGNIFVADQNNNAVYEIVAVDGVVSHSSTVKTIGSGFFEPTGVAVDGIGNVFVADTANSAVKEIVAVGGVVSSSSAVKTIGSGFNTPAGVAVDGSGNVFVADTANSAVKEIVAVGGVVSLSSTVNTVGTGFSGPVGVAVYGSGNVFVADQNASKVKEIDLSDPPSLSFPTATNAGSTDTTDGPQTVTVANSGNAALTFTVPASGDNPSISADFTLDSTSGGTCPLTTGTPNTLAAGARCTLPISFAPTVGGAIGGSLVLTDTHLNANPSTTQTIALNGTGLLLTPTLGFAAIPAHIYGDTPFIVTASSLSSGAVTYTVLSGPATISGSTVTLTGGGTVTLSASQTATTVYAAATATTSFVVGPATPMLIFATTPHVYGDAPFSVSATSVSSGAVTYAVLSGPATISGNTVTLTGAGTVVLSANQAATASYTAAVATASFTVGQPPAADFSVGTPGTTSSQNISAGGTATFSFSLAPVGGAYPGVVSFTATGLPAGATATFSPASIAANGGAQTVTLTVKTSTSAQAKLDMPVSHRGGLIVFALLFLPLVGTRRMRRVARKLGRGTGLALLLLLSLGAVAGLSGCGGDGSHSTPAPTAKSYTIAVTATSGSAQHTTNFTLQVQ